jgi:hypothetical protein
MKILKRLAACAVALSMAACTAFGTFTVSAEENTETDSGTGTQLTRLALPNFVPANDLSFLDGEITEVSEADVFNWVEQNFEYLQSFDDYVDIIFGKTEDGDFLVLDREFYEYDDYADFIESEEASDYSGDFICNLSIIQEWFNDNEYLMYALPPVDVADCDIQLDLNAKTMVSVVFNGDTILPSEYSVIYEGVDVNYSSPDYPDAAGTYKVIVTANEGSYYLVNSSDKLTFTIEPPEESSEETPESSESAAPESAAPEAESSAAESKADTSSKATSDSSTKNPGTGAAAALGMIGLAAASVIVLNKKSK